MTKEELRRRAAKQRRSRIRAAKGVVLGTLASAIWITVYLLTRG